jgi:hypothetical protein
MLDSRRLPANRSSVRALGRILADACIGMRQGAFQSLRRAAAFATQQGSCRRVHLPCVAGKAGLNAAAGGHLPCAVCRDHDRRGPSRAVSYSSRAPQAAQGRALARSGQDSRRGAKAGVRIHDRSMFFYIRLVTEAFTDGQPSLLLGVRGESEPGLVDVSRSAQQGTR